MSTVLKANIDKLHTTELGKKRIQKNLSLEDNVDVVIWCKEKIAENNNIIFRKGKNWYIHCDDCCITINISSYTIITAHKS